MISRRLQKIPAFTLFELVIVSLVGAIVLSLALWVLNTFRNMAIDYKEQQETLARISTLHRLLAQDFSHAQTVVRTRKGIDCIYKDKTITYQWYREEAINRTQNKVTDYFPAYPQKEHLLYQGKETYIQEQPIDELYFEIVEAGETMPFHFFKTYDAARLMVYENQ